MADDTTTTDVTKPKPDADEQALAAIPFHAILGGPLQAAVQAQTLAAGETLRFVHSLVGSGSSAAGAGPSQGVQTVPFDFESMSNILTDSLELNVPLISLVPIPYLEVSSLNVQFNAQLSSQEHTQDTNTFNTQATDSGGGNWLIGKTNFTATISDQNVWTDQGAENRQYSLQVTLQATQSALPGGLSKVLQMVDNVLETEAQGVQAKIVGSKNAAAGGAPTSGGGG